MDWITELLQLMIQLAQKIFSGFETFETDLKQTQIIISWKLTQMLLLLEMLLLLHLLQLLLLPKLL